MEMMAQRYIKDPHLAHIEGKSSPNSIWLSTATTLSASIPRQPKKPTSYLRGIAAC
jgi:hypothetical protein